MTPEHELHPMERVGIRMACPRSRGAITVEREPIRFSGWELALLIGGVVLVGTLVWIAHCAAMVL